MKIAIWGTGKYYKKYISYIHEDAIEYIVDSDVNKQGTFIDNRVICAPESIDLDVCDYILILVKKTEEIREYLIAQGVEGKKVVDYRSIGKLFEVEPMVHAGKSMMKLEDWICLTSKKKILFFSHSLGRSGAPIVLMNLASLLLDKYQILFAGEGQGDLQNELESENIDYLADVGIFYEKIKSSNLLEKFDLFLVNTIIMSDWIEVLSEKKVPVVWWIHESSSMFYEGSNRLHNNVGKVSCYAVSEKAEQKMREYYLDMHVERLSYYLPDTGEVCWNTGREKGTKFKFALLGVIDWYKAQDLVLEAIKKIDSSVRGQFEVIVAGSIISKEKERWERAFAQCPQIKYVGELSQKEVDDLYKEMDALLCTSRVHDTMPVVVTQAMMHGIPCIVSDKVGQSTYIEHQKSGFFFCSEDIDGLVDAMQWCIKNRNKMGEIGRESRRIYEKYFSQENIRKKIEEIIDQHLM